MATFTIFWQLMVICGNLWYLVATYDSLRQLLEALETFGNFWQLLATLAIFGILEHCNILTLYTDQLHGSF